MPAAPVSEAKLNAAARVAKAEQCVIVIEAGRLTYRIEPLPESDPPPQAEPRKWGQLG